MTLRRVLVEIRVTQQRYQAALDARAGVDDHGCRGTSRDVPAPAESCRASPYRVARPGSVADYGASSASSMPVVVLLGGRALRRPLGTVADGRNRWLREGRDLTVGVNQGSHQRAVLDVDHARDAQDLAGLFDKLLGWKARQAADHRCGGVK